MKALMRTIIVFAVLNSVMGSFAMAEKAEAEADAYRRALEAEPVMVSPENVEPRIELLIELATTSQYSGAGRVLVIPDEETKVQDIITIMEDLSVMSRILDKKLKDAELARDCDWFYGSSFLEWNMPVTKSIHIEGYGVLFLKQVNFPISPPGKPKGADKGAEDYDLVWEQARREMYFGKSVWRRRRGKRSSEEYDAKKVEVLKMTLLESLRHAANIRNLEPDEWVIITVIGEGQQGTIIQTETEVQTGDGQSHTIKDTLPADAPGVLTIRVRKSDVDGFAKGELDFDKFRDEVQIFTY